MKTGLGIAQKCKFLHTRWNLFRFEWRKRLLGFERANQFAERVDKDALLRILKKHGATIGRDCDIETGLVFHNCRDYSNLVMGDNCHIGKHCFFDLRDKVELGNNVVVSMQCSFITHIDMNKSTLSRKYPLKASAIYIHDNVYLGAHVTVLMGVEIGGDALVAAKSLVRDDVEPSAIVAGIPAKPLKKIHS